MSSVCIGFTFAIPTFPGKVCTYVDAININI